jgi:hypothetical protein
VRWADAHSQVQIHGWLYYSIVSSDRHVSVLFFLTAVRATDMKSSRRNQCISVSYCILFSVSLKFRSGISSINTSVYSGFWRLSPNLLNITSVQVYFPSKQGLSPQILAVSLADAYFLYQLIHFRTYVKMFWNNFCTCTKLVNIIFCTYMKIHVLQAITLSRI